MSAKGGADLDYNSPRSVSQLITLRDHGYRANVSGGVSVYIPAFAGTHSPTHGVMVRLS